MPDQEQATGGPIFYKILDQYGSSRIKAIPVEQELSFLRAAEENRASVYPVIPFDLEPTRDAIDPITGNALKGKRTFVRREKVNDFLQEAKRRYFDALPVSYSLGMDQVPPPSVLTRGRSPLAGERATMPEQPPAPVVPEHLQPTETDIPIETKEGKDIRGRLSRWAEKTVMDQVTNPRLSAMDQQAMLVGPLQQREEEAPARVAAMDMRPMDPARVRQPEDKLEENVLYNLPQAMGQFLAEDTYASQQAADTLMGVVDFLPSKARGVRDTLEMGQRLVLGDERYDALQGWARSVPGLGKLMRGGDSVWNWLDKSGKLRDQAHANLQKAAMKQGGTAGFVTAELAEGAQETLRMLGLFRALGIGYGEQSGSLNTIKAALTRAGVSAATSPGMDLASKLGTFAISALYQSTPALSGLAPKNWMAVFADIAQNTGITAALWSKTVQDSYDRANAEGNPDYAQLYVLSDLIKAHGTDVIYGSMTRSFKQMGLKDLARKVDQLRPIVSENVIAEEMERTIGDLMDTAARRQEARKGPRPSGVESRPASPEETARFEQEQRAGDVGQIDPRTGRVIASPEGQVLSQIAPQPRVEQTLKSLADLPVERFPVDARQPQEQRQPISAQPEPISREQAAPAGEAVSQPKPAKAEPQRATPIETGAATSSNPTGEKTPELMTPEEIITSVSIRDKTGRKAAEYKNAQLIKAALESGKPVSSKLVDWHNRDYERTKGRPDQFARNITIPPGYVREGDRYVYRPAPAPAAQPEAKPPMGEETWFRGERQQNADGDRFFSASEDVAGDYGSVRKASSAEMPKNPLSVQDKQTLADQIGYKGDPLAERLDTPIAEKFDTLAKQYAIKQGYDGIRYENGTFGEPELHAFKTPTPLSGTVSKEPVTGKAAKKKSFPGYRATGATPVIDGIVELGGVKARSKLLNPKQAGEYDAQPTLGEMGGFARFILGGRSQAPDQVAQALYERGVLQEPTADALWNAVRQEIQTYRKQRTAEKDPTQGMTIADAREAGLIEQPGTRLTAELPDVPLFPEPARPAVASEPARPATPVPVETAKESITADALKVGDAFKIDGEEFKVVEETDTALRVQDGVQYWIPYDTSSGNAVVRVDQGSLVRADGQPPAETAREDIDPFALERQTPEQVEAERTRAAQQDAIRKGQDAPIEGRAVDTTGDLFDADKADAPLFAAPTPRAQETATRLTDALEKLPDAQREAFRAVVVDGKTVAQYAKEADIPISAVEKRLNAARQKMAAEAKGVAPEEIAKLLGGPAKSLPTEIVQRLDQLADNAMKRILKRRSEGRMMMGLDPADVRDFAVYGAAKILKGVVRFAEWSRDMVARFGKTIEPNLREIYDASKQAALEIQKARTTKDVDDIVVQPGMHERKTITRAAEMDGGKGPLAKEGAELRGAGKSVVQDTPVTRMVSESEAEAARDPDAVLAKAVNTDDQYDRAAMLVGYLNAKHASSKDAAPALDMLSKDATVAGTVLRIVRELKTGTPEGRADINMQIFKRWAERAKAKISREQYTAIRKKFSEAEAITDDAARKVAIRDAADFAVLHVPRSRFFWSAYRYSNVLSNPRSHLRNFWGNTLQVAVAKPVSLVATGHPVEAYRYLEDSAKATGKAFEAFMEAMRGNDDPGKVFEEAGRTMFDEAMRRRLPGVVTFIPKLMDAADRFAVAMVEAGESARLMRRGVTPSVANERAKKTAEKFLFHQNLGTAMNDPTQNVAARILDGVGHGLEQARKLPVVGPVLVSPVLMFLRTPFAVAKMGTEASPLGYAARLGLNDIARQRYKKPFDKLSKDQQAIVTDIRQERVGLARAGTAVTVVGAALAMMGNTTWAPPKDEEEKRLFYDSGRKPYSVRIGDTWLPMLTFGPFALALAIPAAARDVLVDNPQYDGENIAQKMVRFTQEMARFTMEQTPFSSFASFMENVMGDSYDPGKFMAFTAQQLIPASGFINYVNQWVDPYFRRPKGFTENLMVAIPGLSQKVLPHTTASGDPAERTILDILPPYSAGKADDSLDAVIKRRREELRGNAEKRKGKREREDAAARAYLERYERRKRNAP